MGKISRIIAVISLLLLILLCASLSDAVFMTNTTQGTIINVSPAGHDWYGNPKTTLTINYTTFAIAKIVKINVDTNCYSQGMTVYLQFDTYNWFDAWVSSWAPKNPSITGPTLFGNCHA